RGGRRSRYGRDGPGCCRAHRPRTRHARGGRGGRGSGGHGLAAVGHEVDGDVDLPGAVDDADADVVERRVDEVLVVVGTVDERRLDALDVPPRAHVLAQLVPVDGDLVGEVHVVGDGA